jgi:hypothetical protein
MTKKKFDTHTGWTIKNEVGHRRAYLMVVIDPEDFSMPLIEKAYYDAVRKLIKQLDEGGFKEQAARYGR